MAEPTVGTGVAALLTRRLPRPGPESGLPWTACHAPRCSPAALGVTAAPLLSRPCGHLAFTQRPGLLTREPPTPAGEERTGGLGCSLDTAPEVWFLSVRPAARAPQLLLNPGEVTEVTPHHRRGNCISGGSDEP